MFASQEIYLRVRYRIRYFVFNIAVFSSLYFELWISVTNFEIINVKVTHLRYLGSNLPSKHLLRWTDSSNWMWRWSVHLQVSFQLLLPVLLFTLCNSYSLHKRSILSLNLPIGLWSLRSSTFMLNLILMYKAWKYISDKLWTIISGDSKWQSINAKDLLQTAHRFLFCCGFHYFNNLVCQQEQTTNLQKVTDPEHLLLGAPTVHFVTEFCALVLVSLVCWLADIYNMYGTLFQHPSPCRATTHWTSGSSS